EHDLLAAELFQADRFPGRPWQRELRRRLADLQRAGVEGGDRADPGHQNHAEEKSHHHGLPRSWMRIFGARHSITRAIRCRSACGNSSLSALATFRLMASSILELFSTGMVAGFSPFRILTTSRAA